MTVTERSGEQEREMAMRMSLVTGCLAIGAAAIVLTGTAAQAATLSGAHATVSAARLDGGGSAAPTASPSAIATSPSPSVSPSPSATTTSFPSSGPNTGGGGSITGGGSDTPLVAGGAAAAVAGAWLALLGFRRWRRDRGA